jgi:hypothetical protein
MPSRIRFSSAQQIFEVFPTAAEEIQARPRNERPEDFALSLIASGERFESVVYAAYLLPRREAVWWGCQCLRALREERNPAALQAAEAWVRDPDDETRRAALDIWQEGDRTHPATWLAFAAAHSGGNIAPPEHPPRTPAPHMTALGVRSAVILAIVAKPTSEQPAWLRACVEACVRFGQGGEAKVMAPSPPAARAQVSA